MKVEFSIPEVHTMYTIIIALADSLLYYSVYIYISSAKDGNQIDHPLPHLLVDDLYLTVLKEPISLYSLTITKALPPTMGRQVYNVYVHYIYICFEV